jgi:hypothetical protein
MDNYSAFNRPNSYPAYTLAELKAKVAAGNTNPLMIAEIAYREANAL